MIRTLVPALVFALAAPAFAKGGDAPKAAPKAAEVKAAPTVWEIDGAHSAATFAVRHMMVSNVRGEFGKVSGSVTVPGADFTKATVEATIDAGSINTRNEKRDGHLKSPDFFDVAKFPTLTFKSKKIERSGAGHKMTGDLTIRGVTKEVVFDVEGPSAEAKNPWGVVVVGASATAKINRKEFGLNWNKALEAGGVVVGEEVTITLDIELNRKAAEAKK